MPSVFVLRRDSVLPVAALSGKKSNEELKRRQSLNDQTIDYLVVRQRANERFDQPDD
jgi:hypothetical protein